MTVTSNFDPNIRNAGATALISTEPIDIETMIMIVKSKRVDLMDQQLKTQIEGVQRRNEQIGRLNEVLNKLNVFLGAMKGSEPTSTIDGWNNDKIQRYEIPLNDAILAAGIKDLGFSGGAAQVTSTSDSDIKHEAGGRLVEGATNLVKGQTTKSQIDAAIAKVKSLIDAAGNEQQLDMIRLQSMNGKRIEAVDLMSTFLKKGQDSKTGVIRNV